MAGDHRIDFTVTVDDQVAFAIEDGLGSQAADKLGGIAAFVIGVDGDAAGGAAVILTHDDVLGDVHQTTGQVAGVRRTQCGVHQTLTGAVGGDDVLGNRQAFAEVGANRKVNDFPLRVRHQTAHTDQLTHLGHVSPGPRVGHHPDRVERVVLVEVLFDFFDQTLVGFRPGVDHLGVTFHLGDLTQAVALLGVRDLLLGFFEQTSLFARDAQVIHGDGDGGLGGVVEAEILELVRQGGGGGGAVVLVGPSHQVPQLLLIDRPVTERRSRFAQGSVCGCWSLSLCGLLAGLLAGLFGGGGGHGCARRKGVRG